MLSLYSVKITLYIFFIEVNVTRESVLFWQQQQQTNNITKSFFVEQKSQRTARQQQQQYLLFFSTLTSFQKKTTFSDFCLLSFWWKAKNEDEWLVGLSLSFFCLFRFLCQKRNWCRRQREKQKIIPKKRKRALNTFIKKHSAAISFSFFLLQKVFRLKRALSFFSSLSLFSIYTCSEWV